MSEPTLIARTTTEWQALDAAQHLHPFYDRNLMALHGARIITGGVGVYLWDSEGHHALGRAGRGARQDHARAVDATAEELGI